MKYSDTWPYIKVNFQVHQDIKIKPENVKLKDSEYDA